MKDHSNEPDSRQQRGYWFFVTIGLCVFWMISVGVIGGLVCYFVTSVTGAESTATKITGAVAAFVTVCLTSPAGVAIYFLVLPDEPHNATRTLLSFLAAAVSPMIHGGTIVVLAIVAAIPGASLFHWLQPGAASIAAAFVFPLLGFVSGILIGSPGNDSG